MNRNLTTEILLGFAVILTWVCTAGILKMRNAFEKLHYLAPVATLSTIAIVVAILLNEPLSQTGTKLILIALLMLGTNAVLTHATAQAARLRGSGRRSMPAGQKPPKRPKKS